MPAENDRSWKYRRRLTFLIAGFACIGLTYLLIWGEDHDLHRRMAETFGTILITTILIYVGGATADDALKDKFSGRGVSYEQNNMAPHRGQFHPEQYGPSSVPPGRGW